MKTVAIHTIKGGVGKTFFASQFAGYCAYELNLRVLCIDLDEQHSFYNWGDRHRQAGGKVDFLDTNVFDILLKTPDEYELYPGIAGNLTFIEALKGLKIEQTALKDINDMPLTLANIKRYFREGNDNEHCIKLQQNLYQFIKAVDDYYDICIIDNPTSTAAATLEPALLCADRLIVMTEAAQHSIDGVNEQLATLSLIFSRFKRFRQKFKMGELRLSPTDWIKFIPNKMLDNKKSKDRNTELLSKISSMLLFLNQYALQKGVDGKPLINNDGKFIIRHFNNQPAAISQTERYNNTQNNEAIFQDSASSSHHRELRQIFYEIINIVGVSNPAHKSLTDEEKQILEMAQNYFGVDWKFLIHAFWSHNENLPLFKPNESNKLRELKAKITATDLDKLQVN